MAVFDLEVEDRPDALSEARHWVSGLVGPAAAGAALDALLVVVTELLANAHRHAVAGPCVLRVTVHDDGVRVEVSDPSPTRPPARSRPATDDAESGRGLLLVAALSSRWGSGPRPLGKCVWAEVPFGERGS